MQRLPTAENIELLLSQLPTDREHDYAVWDQEIRQIYQAQQLLLLTAQIALEMELGGFEHYFLSSSGAGALLCEQALEVTGAMS